MVLVENQRTLRVPDSTPSPPICVRILSRTSGKGDRRSNKLQLSATTCCDRWCLTFWPGEGDLRWSYCSPELLRHLSISELVWRNLARQLGGHHGSKPRRSWRLRRIEDRQRQGTFSGSATKPAQARRPFGL